MKYRYTLLKQDGTKEDLGTFKSEMSLDEMRSHLNCQWIQIIPNDYYYRDDVTLFGDEEGRYNSANYRNPHFKVLTDIYNQEWDVIGNIIEEARVR